MVPVLIVRMSITLEVFVPITVRLATICHTMLAKHWFVQTGRRGESMVNQNAKVKFEKKVYVRILSIL